MVWAAAVGAGLGILDKMMSDDDKTNTYQRDIRDRTPEGQQALDTTQGILYGTNRQREDLLRERQSLQSVNQSLQSGIDSWQQPYAQAVRGYGLDQFDSGMMDPDARLGVVNGAPTLQLNQNASRIAQIDEELARLGTEDDTPGLQDIWQDSYGKQLGRLQEHREKLDPLDEAFRQHYDKILNEEWGGYGEFSERNRPIGDMLARNVRETPITLGGTGRGTVRTPTNIVTGTKEFLAWQNQYEEKRADYLDKILTIGKEKYDSEYKMILRDIKLDELESTLERLPYEKAYEVYSDWYKFHEQLRWGFDASRSSTQEIPYSLADSVAAAGTGFDIMSKLGTTTPTNANNSTQNAAYDQMYYNDPGAYNGMEI